MRLFLSIVAALMIAGPAMAQMVSSAPGIPNPVTSAQLAAAITDETGTGSAVFADTPTMVTPNFTTGITFGTDTPIFRDATNVLAQRNGANAETFRLYNTFTDASNYERLAEIWSGNTVTIKPEAAGTGTLRDLQVGIPTRAVETYRATTGANGAFDFSVGAQSVASGALITSSGSLTASSGVQYGFNFTPIINQTVTGGYTGIFENVTETATGSGAKLLMDLQVASTSKFSVDDTGSTIMADGRFGSQSSSTASNINYNTGGLQNGSAAVVAWTSGAANATKDTWIRRVGAANLGLGAADAAAPVAQTLSVQSVIAGTSNTAGADFIVAGSQGTGTGAGGAIIFKTAPAGSTGTAQNPEVTAFKIDQSGVPVTPPKTVATLPTCVSGLDGARSYVTDDLATLVFGAAVTAGGSNHTPVYCDGSGTPAWKIG